MVILQRELVKSYGKLKISKIRKNFQDDIVNGNNHVLLHMNIIIGILNKVKDRGLEISDVKGSFHWDGTEQHTS